MKLIRTLIIIICIFLIAFGLYKIYGIQSGYSEGDDAYKALEAYIEIPLDGEPVTETSSASQEEAESDKETSELLKKLKELHICFPEVRFSELAAINPEIVGWIYCKDTHINYPVVQTDNNDYYLKHMFSKEENKYGCLFMDYRNQKNLSDRNTVIYGHNMKNGSMFAELVNYKQQDYYDKHPYFLLLTPKGNYVVELFAGYVASTVDNAWLIKFESDAAYENWLHDSINKSCFKSDVVPTAQDKVLTLSTCSYEYDGARFVLLGILKKCDRIIKDGEKGAQAPFF